MYKKFFKRPMDIFLSFVALVFLSPIILIISIINTIIMRGNPFFLQLRPGMIDETGVETTFYLFKFKTMNNVCNADGELLPDENRITKFGKLLRSSSLDELPSLINIIVGQMSIVGPRPQLVKDMFFMTEEQRRRHSVRPGLTGLAQVNGRNNISWEKKFEYDLEYIDKGITFLGDVKIIFYTIAKVLKRSDIVREGTVSDLDLGDWLMKQGRVSEHEYNDKQAYAKNFINM